jgi:protein TonB
MLAAVATYSVQVALLVIVAALVALAARSHPPTMRLAYWRFVILLSVTLPMWPADLFAGRMPSAATDAITIVSEVVVRNTATAPEQSWAGLLLWILAAGMLLRAAWLGAGTVQLGRLRSNSTEAQLDDAIDELRKRLAPNAELRWHAQINQPVTFGLRRPVVLLPPAIRDLSPDARLAVVCHELLHVARRDWLWLWMEEAVRTLFWFHPLMRWAVGQVRLGREQTVDARVIALTGTRRAYMDAIVRFAGPQPAIGLGMPFAERQHVVLRLRALAKEPIMSRTRVIVTAMALILSLVAASGSIATALPLSLPQAAAGPDPFEGTTPALIQPVTLRFANASLSAILNSLGTIGGVRITYEKGFEDRRYSVEFQGVTPGEAMRQVLSANNLTYRGLDEKTIVVVQKGTATPGVADFVAPPPPAPPRPAPSTAPQAGRSGTVVGSSRPGETTAPLEPQPTLAEERLAPGPRPLRITGDMQPPRKIFDVNPVYPKDAMEAKVQGVVILDTIVGTDGFVKGLRIVRSVPLLDQAAMDAVNLWRFEPGLLNGVPVEVEVTVTLNFKLAK